MAELIRTYTTFLYSNWKVATVPALKIKIIEKQKKNKKKFGKYSAFQFCSHLTILLDSFFYWHVEHTCKQINSNDPCTLHSICLRICLPLGFGQLYLCSWFDLWNSHSQNEQFPVRCASAHNYNLNVNGER